MKDPTPIPAASALSRLATANTALRSPLNPFSSALGVRSSVAASSASSQALIRALANIATPPPSSRTYARSLAESIAAVSRASVASSALRALSSVEVLPPPTPTRIPQLPLPIPSPTRTSSSVSPRKRWDFWLEARVRLLDASLRQRHEGAWDAIDHGGADCLSQAANSLVELINGVVRKLAPQTDVLDWLSKEGSPDWAYDDKGRPTRRARLNFLLSQHDVPERSASSSAAALTDIANDLQKIKHGRTGSSFRFIICSLITFENFLVLVSDHEQYIPVRP